jgi:hypothetical protein
MCDNTKLIRSATFDIVSVITFWALVNNPNIQYGNYYIDLKYNNNNIRLNYVPFYSVFLGFGFSTAILMKYF